MTEVNVMANRSLWPVRPAVLAHMMAERDGGCTGKGENVWRGRDHERRRKTCTLRFIITVASVGEYPQAEARRRTKHQVLGVKACKEVDWDDVIMEPPTRSPTPRISNPHDPERKDGGKTERPGAARKLE